MYTQSSIGTCGQLFPLFAHMSPHILCGWISRAALIWPEVVDLFEIQALCLNRLLQTSDFFWHFVSHSITLFTASCIFDAVVYIKSVAMVASVIWFRRFCVCRIWRKICYLKNQLSIFLWLLSINAMDFFYPKIKERFLIWWLSYQLSQWLGFDHCS